VRGAAPGNFRQALSSARDTPACGQGNKYGDIIDGKPHEHIATAAGLSVLGALLWWKLIPEIHTLDL
jgi:hypothetical protein